MRRGMTPRTPAPRPELRLRDLVLRDGAAELALQELHELDHPDRVDHAAAEQRRVVLQRPVRAHVEEVFAHVRARTVRDPRSSQFRCLVTHRSYLPVTRQTATGASAAAGGPRDVSAVRPAAKSNSRWSRNGTRASIPCAIAIRSPCELSRYDESSVVISR